MQPTSYVLPIRAGAPVDDEFVRYVRGLTARCQVIVVDGSPAAVFGNVRSRCGSDVLHIPPDPDLRSLANGKVAGVLTGLRYAAHERVVIADDDVRYTPESLVAVVAALDAADVVRPQNYFDPMPWHACVDTARSLINRVTGGDWPGTLAVRRSVLVRTDGYDGDVLFENLELVRTVKASGGREAVPRDLFVRRLPPTTDRFFSQRVRQAYDEFARPARLAVWLSILPAVALAARARGRWGVAGVLAASIAAAEAGRRIGGGVRVFPVAASLAAPLWLLERATAAWLALGARIALGGVPYRGKVLRRAATPMRELRRRHADSGRVNRTRRAGEQQDVLPPDSFDRRAPEDIAVRNDNEDEREVPHNAEAHS